MHRKTGFTLVEVLLTLALIAMASTVVLSGTSQFFQARDDRPDDKFWQAVTAARQAALEQEQPVTLSYDQKTKSLQWKSLETSESLELPVKTFRFLPETRDSTYLIGGVLTETTNLERVKFYPDGTCDAFRVEIVETDNRREIIRIDPWTCAPILTATE